MTVDRRTWLKLATVGAGASVASSSIATSAAAIAPPASPAPTVTVLTKGTGKTAYSKALSLLADYIALHLKDYALPGMTFCVADKEGFSAVITPAGLTWTGVSLSVRRTCSRSARSANPSPPSVF